MGASPVTGCSVSLYVNKNFDIQIDKGKVDGFFKYSLSVLIALSAIPLELDDKMHLLYA